MEKRTEQHLIALNRRFYNEFATAFSDSRGATEPGLERLVAQIRAGSRVLDLGCGQARLAQLLPPSCTYVGVDGSEEMLRVAAVRTASAVRTVAATGTVAETTSTSARVTLITGDLIDGEWDTLVGGAFDWVVLRAVLHHIPGYQNRLTILRRAAGVRAPGGRIIVANWQFLKIERLRRRTLPWSTVGLTSDDVDPGDYLLDWAREGSGLRYAHLIDETETKRLATDAGLHTSELFYADGHTNDLTLYAVLE